MNERMELTKRVAKAFEKYADIKTIAIAGSVTNEAADDLSDIDLYIYAKNTPELKTREKIASQFADKTWLDNRFWETGDEWIDKESGIAVDIMYRSRDWIESQLENVAIKHNASVGYTTCFWHNVVNSVALVDKNEWYGDLQKKYQISYPRELTKNIAAKNFPILKSHISSYFHQIEKMIKRGDGIGVNHRIAAFLASYFDILFAVNALLHPGEKRLLQFSEKTCKILPESFAADIRELLEKQSALNKDLLNVLARLELNLLEILVKEGLWKK